MEILKCPLGKLWWQVAGLGVGLSDMVQAHGVLDMLATISLFRLSAETLAYDLF